MTHKDTKLAEEYLRAYRQITRLNGLVYVDDDGVWVLSRPTFPSDLEQQLLKFLMEPLDVSTYFTRRELVELLGCRELIEVDKAVLGQTRFQARKIDKRELTRLVKSGVKPAKSLRDTGWKKKLKASLDMVDRLESLSPRTRGFFPSVDAEQWPTRPAFIPNLAAVFGQAEAERVRIALESTIGPDRDRLPEVQEIFRRFLATANQAVKKQSTSAKTQQLYDDLQALPVASRARARRLIALFRQELAQDADLLPIDSSEREIEAMVVEDIAAAAKRLTQLAEANLQALGPVAAYELTPNDIAAVAQAQMYAGGYQLKFLPNLDSHKLTQMCQLVRNFEPKDLPAVWPAVLKHRNPWYLGFAADMAKFDGASIAEAITHDLHHLTENLKPTQFKRMLKVARLLREHPIPGVSITTHEIVDSFRAKHGWTNAAALVLVSPTNDEIEPGINALAKLPEGQWLLPQAKRYVDQEPSHRPPEVELVSQALNLTISEVLEYLHYREWSGHGVTFSAPILKCLRIDEEEARQIEAVKAQLRDEDSPELHRRLENLSDPERRDARRQKAIDRARKAFDRSKDALPKDAEAGFRSWVSRVALQRILGTQLSDDRAPDHADQVVLLFGADEIDLKLARKFAVDVVHQRDLTESSPNATWLDAMREKFDVDNWLNGFEFKCSVEGRVLTFRTETNPFHVLKMGTYFDTCLTLTDGFNAASTLANALDVNKAVIYGYDENGKVFARKLIAVTDDATLLGYYTYAHEHGQEVAFKLNAALLDWAKELGLKPTTQGAPKSLHQAFWYDDGAEPWRTHTFAPDLDIDLRAELSFIRGFSNSLFWRRADELDRWPWNHSSKIWLKLNNRSGYDFWLNDHVVQIAVQAKAFEAFFGIEELSVFQLARTALQHLPAHRDWAIAFLEAIAQTRTRELEGYWQKLPKLPPTLSLAPFHVIVPGLVALVEHADAAGIECIIDHHEDCQLKFCAQAAWILDQSAERGGVDDSVMQLFEHKHPLVQKIGLEFAHVRPIPEAGKHLRAEYRRQPTVDLGRALKLLEDDASQWTVSDVEFDAPAKPKLGVHMGWFENPAWETFEDVDRSNHPYLWYHCAKKRGFENAPCPWESELTALPIMEAFTELAPFLRDDLLLAWLDRAASILRPSEYSLLLTFVGEKCTRIHHGAFRSGIVESMKTTNRSYRLQLMYLKHAKPLDVADSKRYEWLLSELEA